MKIKVPIARKIFALPASAPFPADHFIATGSKDTPIIVTTVPVTTSGKNFRNFPKKGATRNTNSPAIRTAPKIVVIAV